jgi:hypothetical protein
MTLSEKKREYYSCLKFENISDWITLISLDCIFYDRLLELQQWRETMIIFNIIAEASDVPVHMR